MSKTAEETIQKEDSVELKVASSSDSVKVAGAIVKYMNEGYKVTILVIGAGAVNQAVKAVAIARGMGATAGMNLYCIPSFYNKKFRKDDPSLQMTAIKIAVYDMKL
jgi:stage V sporulation protein S